MKLNKLFVALAACALALTLVACGGESYLSMEPLDEVSGVRITAENASKGSACLGDRDLEVKEGDVIIISPDLTKGSFHLTITNSDDETVVYDEDVDGRVLFQTAAVPGTYDVSVEGNNATGSMTVFAESTEELDQQNASLEEALEEAGVDADALEKDE